MTKCSTQISWHGCLARDSDCKGYGRGARAKISCCIAALASVIFVNGCTKPNAANIELRKQVQTLEDANAQLKTQHAGDAASLKAHESGTTLPSLGQGKIDTLFTTHGIRFGKLTAGLDSDRSKPGDEGVRVSVIPFDQDNDDLKAAGVINIDAFDLADADAHIGHWEFPPEQARALWNGKGLLYEYLLSCPWQTAPKHNQLTIRVTFIDTLTGRSFSEQKIVTIQLP